MRKITKISKINDSFSVYMYDNGFMIELSGRNEDDDYVSSKILCTSLDELKELVEEATGMLRNE